MGATVRFGGWGSGDGGVVGDHTYDLAIVGGGIGGSALATVMQRAGRSCLVLERTAEFPDRTKGEWLAPWGVAEAGRLGLLDVISEARGHVLRRHAFFDPEIDPEQALGEALNLALLPGIDGPMTQRHPDACQALYDAATAAGAHARRDVDVTAIEAGSRPAVSWTDGEGEHRASVRLLVGADGRNSMVRRALGLDLDKDPPHHLFSGLLVDGADGWPDDLQAIGVETDVHFLAFPQGAGRVRLYLGFGLDQAHRMAGTGGPAAFLEGFRLACLPASAALADATPISPCATYANEDAWVDVPVVDGAVLVGDAAGWNDPITGQGLSITLRDVRLVRDVLEASADWSPRAFAPYVEERRERMRRLRFGAQVQSALFNEFGPAAQARRSRALARFAQDRALMMPLLASMIGPDLAPEESFSEETRDRILLD